MIIARRICPKMRGITSFKLWNSIMLTSTRGAGLDLAERVALATDPSNMIRIIPA